MGRSSASRTLASEARGPWCESRRPCHAGLAQREEHSPDKREARGSSPWAGTSFVEALAQRGRAPVSKTGRWEFESLAPRQPTRLKELETLEKVTEKIDKISVFGGLEGVLKDLVKIR